MFGPGGFKNRKLVFTEILPNHSGFDSDYISSPPVITRPLNRPVLDFRLVVTYPLAALAPEGVRAHATLEAALLAARVLPEQPVLAQQAGGLELALELQLLLDGENARRGAAELGHNTPVLTGEATECRL